MSILTTLQGARLPTDSEPPRHDAHWLAYRAAEVYRGVELAGKRVLEIGSGTGLFCFYAAEQGARSAEGLEPEAAGSTSGVLKQFDAFVKATGSSQVFTHPVGLQEFDVPEEPYDVVLSYNSINHLDEQACSQLPHHSESRETYLQLFKKIRSLVKPGGIFIAWDVGRRNAWNDLKLKNPLEPTIEWHKHQNPSVWISLLREAGFNTFEQSWPPYYPLRHFRLFTGHRTAAYLTGSRFRFTAR